VATTNAILWEGGMPVFAGIDTKTCNANPYAVESAIGPNTKGMLLTYVYGIPCDVEALEKLPKSMVFGWFLIQPIPLM
jgi:dTDP-4-amino-4,6-dideoxygalactose transaminase